jgi:hypothetical protein
LWLKWGEGIKVKKKVATILLLLIGSLFVSGNQSPVIWEAKVPGIVESVKLTPKGAYVGFGYIDVISGVLWYRGNVSLYSLNGSEEWSRFFLVLYLKGECNYRCKDSRVKDAKPWSHLYRHYEPFKNKSIDC